MARTNRTAPAAAARSVKLTTTEAARLRELAREEQKATEAAQLAIAEARLAVLKAAQAKNTFLDQLGTKYRFDAAAPWMLDEARATLNAPAAA